MDIRNLDEEKITGWPNIVIHLHSAITQLRNMNSNITCKIFIQGKEQKMIE